MTQEKAFQAVCNQLLYETSCLASYFSSLKLSKRESESIKTCCVAS